MKHLAGGQVLGGAFPPWGARWGLRWLSTCTCSSHSCLLSSGHKAHWLSTAVALGALLLGEPPVKRKMRPGREEPSSLTRQNARGSWEEGEGRDWVS